VLLLLLLLVVVVLSNPRSMALGIYKETKLGLIDSCCGGESV